MIYRKRNGNKICNTILYNDSILDLFTETYESVVV